MTEEKTPDDMSSMFAEMEKESQVGTMLTVMTSVTTTLGVVVKALKDHCSDVEHMKPVIKCLSSAVDDFGATTIALAGDHRFEAFDKMRAEVAAAKKAQEDQKDQGD